MYHMRDKQPPLPIYVGLLLHAQTRKRTLIDKLYNLGLSISYDRVLSTSTDVGNAVSALFEEERLVCPSNLCKHLFTTAGVDNIDHNPSSITAQHSFHETRISLFQHVGNSAGGTPRNATRITGNPKERKKSITQLRDDYAVVKPKALRVKEPDIGGAEIKKAEMMCDSEEQQAKYEWHNSQQHNRIICIHSLTH